jgi:hypothetical protein
MEVTVWVDDWQMQCCGRPFAVGSHVVWTLGPPALDRLEVALGTDAGVIDLSEDHHGALPEGTPATSGRVTSIKAVHRRLAPPPRDARAGPPAVHAGVTLRTVGHADGWEPQTPQSRFLGYIVQLHTLDGPPTSSE